MGLLTRALAGGVAAAADTTANIMVSNNNARLASERDRSNALREENLTRLRQTLQEQSADKAFTRSETAQIAQEDRAYGRAESGMVNTEGVPLTRAEADALRKQETQAQQTEMEQGPVAPKKSGLIASSKYSEENTISKDFVTPDGKLISVADAKQRQKEGLPLKMREDLEHERARTEKDTDYKRDRKDKDADRGKDMDDYRKKKGIDTAADIEKERAKAKVQSKVDEMTPSVAAGVAARLMALKEKQGELDTDQQMLLDVALERATGKVRQDPNKVFKGSGVTTPIPPKGKQPKSEPAQSRFVIKSVK